VILNPSPSSSSAFVAVVVRLEPVEVEEDQQRRHPCRQPLVEVEEELAPVRQPGECVGLGVTAALLQQLGVLAERQRHPSDHGPDCRRREEQRRMVQAVEVVIDEQAEAEQAEAHGHGEDAEALEPPVHHRARRLPGAEGEEQ
jgi:hypothetical protein